MDPLSRQVVAALRNVDGIVGLLLKGLVERNLHRCVNLMVVSDHGETGTGIHLLQTKQPLS